MKHISRMLVFDTNSYSGNFERQLCAYVTGFIGDCGVGAEFVCHEEMSHEIISWCDDNVILQPDENKYFRPCTIWTTPNRCNDGNGKHLNDSERKPNKHYYPAYESVAIFVKEFPPTLVLDEMVYRAVDFFLYYQRKKDKKIKLLKVRQVEHKTVTTESVVDVPCQVDINKIYADCEEGENHD